MTASELNQPIIANLLSTWKQSYYDFHAGYRVKALATQVRCVTQISLIRHPSDKEINAVIHSRLKLMATLAEYLIDKDHAIQKILESIKGLIESGNKNVWHSDGVFDMLIPHISNATLSTALETLWMATGQLGSVKNLIHLAIQQPEPIRDALLSEALDMMESWQSDNARSGVLQSYAKYFHEGHLERSLDMVSSMSFDGPKMEGLTYLFPYLNESLYSKAFSILPTFMHERSRARTIFLISMAVPEVFFPAILEMMNDFTKVDDEPFPTALLERIPLELLPRTLEIIRQIPSPGRRTLAFRFLLSNPCQEIRDQVEQEALETLVQIENPSERASYLSQIVPYLSKTNPIKWVRYGLKMVLPNINNYAETVLALALY